MITTATIKPFLKTNKNTITIPKPVISQELLAQISSFATLFNENPPPIIDSHFIRLYRRSGFSLQNGMQYKLTGAACIWAFLNLFKEKETCALITKVELGKNLKVSYPRKFFSSLPRFTNLKTLVICHFEKITDQDLNHISQLKQLSILALGNCTNVTSKGLDALSKLSKLIRLYLAGIGSIPPSGLQPLTKFRCLTSLGLAQSDVISDQHLSILSQLKLTQLDLIQLSCITVKMCVTIQKMKHLRKLLILNCQNITSDNVQTLVNNNPNLTKCTLVVLPK